MQLVRLGTLCNNACVFCAQAPERARGGESPSDQVVRASIAEAAASGDVVAFVGGEPTLHAALATWVQLARTHGASSVVLQTNARRLAYAAYARDLHAAGLAAADVSLHGSTEAMHDYHTGTAGSFAQTVRGMKHARAAGLVVLATCVVTRSNYRNLPDIVRIAHAAGASAIRFRSPAVLGPVTQIPLRIVPRTPLVEPYLRQARTAADRLGMLSFLVGAARDSQLPFVDYLAEGAEASLQQPPVLAPSAVAPAGRARPATTEQRGRDVKSGPELRRILPVLFTPRSDGER